MKFSGRPQVELGDGGRKVTLLNEFSFWDGNGLQWTTPKGYTVDGSSIPKALWTLVDSPFTGVHRNASIIHDYYCDTHIRSWKATHYMYYEGCRAAGMSEARSKTFYAAVYLGGPRWKDPTLKSGLVIPTAEYSVPLYDEKAAEEFLGRVERENLSLREINEQADGLVSGLSEPMLKQEGTGR